MMNNIPNQQGEGPAHFLDYWRVIRMRKMLIIPVFIIVVTTTTLVTLWMPKTYMGQARIQIGEDHADMQVFGSSSTPGSMFNPFFIETESKIIKSKAVLMDVVENLKLGERWTKRYGMPIPLTPNQAFQRLENQVDIIQERGTSLVDIRVYSDDTNEVAEVANEIARVYRDYRLSRHTEKSTLGVDKIEQEIRQYDQTIETAQLQVEKLRKELEVSDIVAQADRDTPTLDVETVRMMETLRTQSETKYQSLDTELTKLRELRDNGFKEAILHAHPDQTLAVLIQQRDLTSQEITSKQSDFSPEHPEMLKVTSLMSKIESQIEERINLILLGLETQVRAAKAEAEKISERLEQAKLTDIQNNEKHRPYWDAKEEVDRLKEYRRMLQTQLAARKLETELPRTSIVTIIAPADAPVRPVRPNLKLHVAGGVLLGLVFSFSLAFFFEYIDTSMKTIDDVERVLGTPVLAVIPQNISLLMHEENEGPGHESYRVLRTNILFSMSEGAKTFVVASAGAGEGKSTTLCNLAYTFAKEGDRVLIVDSDLRIPSLHEAFGTPNDKGLTAHLMNRCSLEEVLVQTPEPNFHFIPSGKLPSSSMGILNSKAMKDFIQAMRDRYDYVFFDAPPIIGVSDASFLIHEMDHTIHVVQYRKYPQAMTVRAKQTIEKVGGKLLGVVLNNIKLSGDYANYYSGYSYGQYADPSRERETGAPRKDGGEGGTLTSKY